MHQASRLTAIDVPRAGGVPLPGLIDAIGSRDFGPRLVSILNGICGAEHCSLLLFRGDSPVEVGAFSLDGTDTAHRQIGHYLENQYWRVDPRVVAARLNQSSDISMLKLDISSLPKDAMRTLIYDQQRMSESLLLFDRDQDVSAALSILRSDRSGVFRAGELASLSSIAETLLVILRKHAGVTLQYTGLTFALTSLKEIEACLSAAPEKFPTREAEVCARILYGISTAGIALDLGIGEQTVMTYRKRAYERLGIACQRELLLWYLALWNEIQIGARTVAARASGIASSLRAPGSSQQ